MAEPATAQPDPQEEFESSESLAALVRLMADHARSLNRSAYTPNHTAYDRPASDASREISDAGALIAALYTGQTPDSDIGPEDLGDAANARLRALENAREGHYDIAYLCLHQDARAAAIRCGDDPLVSLCPDYFGWKEFERHLEYMELIADDLDTFERDHPID